MYNSQRSSDADNIDFKGSIEALDMMLKSKREDGTMVLAGNMMLSNIAFEGGIKLLQKFNTSPLTTGTAQIHNSIEYAISLLKALKLTKEEEASKNTEFRTDKNGAYHEEFLQYIYTASLRILGDIDKSLNELRDSKLSTGIATSKIEGLKLLDTHINAIYHNRSPNEVTHLNNCIKLIGYNSNDAKCTQGSAMSCVRRIQEKLNDNDQTNKTSAKLIAGKLVQKNNILQNNFKNAPLIRKEIPRIEMGDDYVVGTNKFLTALDLNKHKRPSQTDFTLAHQSFSKSLKESRNLAKYAQK